MSLAAWVRPLPASPTSNGLRFYEDCARHTGTTICKTSTQAAGTEWTLGNTSCLAVLLTGHKMQGRSLCPHFHLCYGVTGSYGWKVDLSPPSEAEVPIFTSLPDKAAPKNGNQLCSGTPVHRDTWTSVPPSFPPMHSSCFHYD